MEKEKPYQPTEEEIKKAEEMMTREQEGLSSDRDLLLFRITGRFLEREFTGMEFLDNGEVELNFGEYETRPHDMFDGLFKERKKYINRTKPPADTISYLTQAELGLESELKRIESQREKIKKAREKILEMLNKEKGQPL